MTWRVVAFDTETALIRPALLAPPLVCVTWQSPGQQPEIVHHSDAEAILRGWFESDALLVGHNVAYDLGVVAERFPALRPLIFQAYAANRVTDTQIRQQLLDIAAGVFRRKIDRKGKRVEHKYTLEYTADRMAGMKLAKDGWRLSYDKFIDVPLEKWPERAREIQAKAKLDLVDAKATLEAIAAAKGDTKLIEARIQHLNGLIECQPEQCLYYPMDDARATLAVYQAQEVHAAYLADQFRQARYAWALHLNSAWGLRTDREGVEKLRKETQADLDEKEEMLQMLGIVRANGTRDTKLAKRRMIDVCAREKLELIRTDSHFAEDCVKCKDENGKPLPAGEDACAEHICLDFDACEHSGDDVLVAYAELSTLKKVLSNDIKALEQGTHWPVHTRYGLAATGRSTSSNPNIQSWARVKKCKLCDGKEGNLACYLCFGKGTVYGVRDAFVPRSGRVFAQADFPQLELYTLAQCCMSWLGTSKLAEALNAGLDPHMSVAARILGTTYEDATKNKKTKDVKDARGAGKVANFGFPGGLGDESLVDYAKKSYGVTLTREQARDLKKTWFAEWPEMPLYFARVNALMNEETNRATVETLFTKRIRGNATYCASCNNGFQALGADCAKRAGWLIAWAEYVGTPSAAWAAKHPALVSPLFNGRTVAFVHDEYIAEVDDDERAHDAAYELAQLMVEGANEYLPNVPIPMSKMEPTLMRRWSKNAVQVFDSNGRLVPWV
jgi:DNA polymerase-1